MSSQELQLRLALMWQQRVAADVQHRPGFEGLLQADPHITRDAVADLDSETMAILRVSLTFYTERELCRIGHSDTNECPYCGAMDGVHHRIVDCPFFSEDRVRCPVPGLAQLPPAQRCHAWATRPQGLV